MVSLLQQPMLTLASNSTTHRKELSSLRPVKRLRTIVRASEKDTATAGEAGTYFYKGKAYTAAEWEEASKSGQLATSESIVDEYKRINGSPTFTELMKFDGVVPERANGRLAMIAVIAAVAAEFSTGKSVFSQLKIEPTFISLTFLIISAATFIPFSKNVDPEEREGIFTPTAEIINGRAAMLGFASLLLIEAVKGGALFGQ